MADKNTIELEIGRHLKNMNDLISDAEIKHDGIMPGESMESWENSMKAVKDLKAQAKRQNDLRGLMSEHQITDVESHGEAESKARAAFKAGADDRYRVDPRSGLTPGLVFTESAEYQELIKRYPNGHGMPDTPRMKSVDLRPTNKKDMVITGSSATSAGSLVWPQFEGLSPYWASYQRPLVVRQLFSQATTGTDTIEYVRVTSVTNNAAPVAEATSEGLPVLPASFSAGGSLVNNTGGGYKPESGMVFERDTVLVQTLAHWIPVTKRALADAGQIQSQIDIFLGYGLEAALESQLLTGNGSSPNLSGLANVSGVQALNQNALPNSAPNDPFIATRKARTLIRINAHCDPTAYLMHPSDWEGMDLQRSGVYGGGASFALTNIAGVGNFLGSGPYEMTQPKLWGLPVVLSEAVATGTVYCAAWNRGVVYDRQEASIQLSDNHADYFVRNLVAILAEERVAFACLQPNAFLAISNFDSTRLMGGSAGTY